MAKKRRFVVPDTKRINLSDGDWIEVKKSLNFSEQNRLNGSALTSVKGGQGDASFGIDWEHYQIIRIETWVLDWSFTEGDEENPKKVAVSRDSIANLDPDTAQEVIAALDAYVAEVEAAKKAQAGQTA